MNPHSLENNFRLTTLCITTRLNPIDSKWGGNLVKLILCRNTEYFIKNDMHVLQNKIKHIAKSFTVNDIRTCHEIIT